MTTYLDYAALSAIIYNSIRGQNNILTNLPAGWELLPISSSSITSTLTGFNAAAYRNTATGANCWGRSPIEFSQIHRTVFQQVLTAISVSCNSISKKYYLMNPSAMSSPRRAS
jgi:hypothetical protein